MFFKKLNVFSLFDTIIYDNLYFECYKKHNNFELNKIVTVKLVQTTTFIRQPLV